MKTVWILFHYYTTNDRGIFNIYSTYDKAQAEWDKLAKQGNNMNYFEIEEYEVA